MSKLDWEKQNRRELPKEYLEDMERHARKRAAQKKYRLKKKAKAIQRKDTPKDRRQSFEAGKQQERERIIQMLEKHLPKMSRDFYISFQPSGQEFTERVTNLIRGEDK